MDRLEKIFRMLEEEESKDDVAEDMSRLEKLTKESKIAINEEAVFFPLVDYLSYRELKCFKKGFAYAMQLMRECDRL